MHELASSVAFFHLAIDQAGCHLPLASMSSSAISLEPVPKVGRQCIEVHIQAITGEDWEAARCQNLLQGVNDLMCRVLRAGAQMEHRKKLRAWVDDQPEPQHMFTTPEPRSQFIELEMREPEMTEGALVQDLRMLASTSQPGGDGGLPVA